MLKIGRELAGIDERVMVKVPINRNGILCVRQLISEGANVTLTAVNSAGQVFLAIAMGARYAAPYLGRMTNSGLNGIDQVTSMRRIVGAMESSLR